MFETALPSARLLLNRLLFASLAIIISGYATVSAPAEASQTLDQVKSELLQCRLELKANKEIQSKTFFAVMVQWPTERHDVDLHVIDVAGEEFHFQNRVIPGRPGELSVDTTSGPGVEIWEVSAAPVGEYQVFYNLYDKHGNADPAEVMGGVFHRDGHYRFRKRHLTNVGRDHAELVAVMTVTSDGNVEVSEW